MRAPEHPDRSPAELHARLDEVLRAAIHGDAPDGAVRARVCTLCDVAHRHGVPVEQLLVLLKDAWRHHPVVRAAPRVDGDEALAELVTLCIREFYRDRATSRGWPTRA